MLFLSETDKYNYVQNIIYMIGQEQNCSSQINAPFSSLSTWVKSSLFKTQKFINFHYWVILCLLL